MTSIEIRAELHEMLVETVNERLTNLESNLASCKRRVSLTDQEFRNEYRYGSTTLAGDLDKDEIVTEIIPNLEKKVALLTELKGTLENSL